MGMVGHRLTPKVDDGITYLRFYFAMYTCNPFWKKYVVGTVFLALVDVCPYPSLISRKAYIGTRSLSSLSSWLHNMSWNVPIPPRNQNKKWLKKTIYDLVIAEAPPRNISPPENGLSTFNCHDLTILGGRWRAYPKIIPSPINSLVNNCLHSMVTTLH